MTASPTRVLLHSRVGVPDPVAAFAYLRRLPGMGKDAVRHAVTELESFAGRRGFGLAGIHFERHPSERQDTWRELITSCRSEGVATVLVPSARHFHHDPVVAALMREELAEKIRGTVFIATTTLGGASHDG
ncbi:hypothetical protein [Actinacidiphila acididurans]|uniref:Recombinase family protein n=1 Tax=Actinacidiphila acididurans TaxID=2784346 RepID=A0ABS2TT28_9ACTN|nr:hypothetical protein [Actinacidiphila acididurans]MBM9506493.1 hypothetical protein [Actinacidiphila acididurans]